MKLKNAEINAIRTHPALDKLMKAKDLSNNLKLKLYKFTFKILDHLSAKALFTTLDDITKKYFEENKEDKTLNYANPVFEEILNQESEIEIDKLTIKEEDIPENITVEDMMMLTWLINFVE